MRDRGQHADADELERLVERSRRARSRKQSRAAAHKSFPLAIDCHRRTFEQRSPRVRLRRLLHLLHSHQSASQGARCRSCIPAQGRDAGHSAEYGSGSALREVARSFVSFAASFWSRRQRTSFLRAFGVGLGGRGFSIASSIRDCAPGPGGCAPSKSLSRQPRRSAEQPARRAPPATRDRGGFQRLAEDCRIGHDQLLLRRRSRAGSACDRLAHGNSVARRWAVWVPTSGCDAFNSPSAGG